MIVSGHACGFEFAGLDRPDFPGRDANFHVKLTHLAHNLEDGPPMRNIYSPATGAGKARAESTSERERISRSYFIE